MMDMALVRVNHSSEPVFQELKLIPVKYQNYPQNRGFTLVNVLYSEFLNLLYK